MGQDTSRVYGSPSATLQPGTYRIANVASKTVIEAPDNDRSKVLAWAPKPELEMDNHQLVRDPFFSLPQQL
jgi:hypothetical protein